MLINDNYVAADSLAGKFREAGLITKKTEQFVEREHELIEADQMRDQSRQARLARKKALHRVK